MKISENEIQGLILKLPENIRHAVNEFDWAKEIMGIAHAHYIQIDDIEEFYQETLRVILGISPAENFEQNVIDALNIDKETAKIIVDEANNKIFRELQRLAFKEENIEESDSYHESIKHSDIKNIMSNQGIEIVDEHELQSFDNDLHKEVAGILDSSVDGNTQPVTHEKRIISENVSHLQTPHEGVQKESYRELIEKSDLRGVKQHDVDTSILKTQHQSNPESLLSHDSITPLEIAPAEKNQSLDERLLTDPFITQTNIVDISPTEEEIINEDGSFLKHLKTSE